MDGERLQELRKDRGLSQKQLAAMLNLSEFTISSYEHGKTEPSDETFCALCDIFNVSADYLLARIDLPLPPQSRARQEDVILLPHALSTGDRYLIRKFVEFVEGGSTRDTAK